MNKPYTRHSFVSKIQSCGRGPKTLTHKVTGHNHDAAPTLLYER